MKLQTLPKELIEKVARGNCVLFLGQNLPLTEDKKLTVSSSLATLLALESNYKEKDQSLCKTAQYYEFDNGRTKLIEKIITDVKNPNFAPLMLYRLVAQLPFNIIITTYYDTFIEQILRSNEKKLLTIFYSDKISHLDGDETILFKLFGCVNKPDTMILTQKDRLFLFDRIRFISDVIKAFFITKTLLFVGYDIDSDEFTRFYYEITRDINKSIKKSYIVFENPSDYIEKYFSEENIEIISIDSFSFFNSLIDECKKFSSIPRTPTKLKIESTFAEKPQISKVPFKFLDCYQESDADIFFGRTLDIEQLLQKIYSNKVVVLFGRSGAGKTSLINAGIIPKLKQKDNIVINIKCTNKLLFELKSILVNILEKLNVQVGVNEKRLSERLNYYLNLIKFNFDGMTVIFLDQFEEFFTNIETDHRKKIVDEFLECIQNKSLDVRFVISLRDDFLLQLDSVIDEPCNIFNNRYKVRKLTRDSAMESILQPLAINNIEIDKNLIEKLLSDLYDDGIEPSQLQIVCSKLYDSLDKTKNIITIENYEKLGGARKILIDYVDYVIQQFPEERRQTIKIILKYMVSSHQTKIPLSFSEISSILRMDDVAINNILSQLINYRIVRRIEEGKQYYYELTCKYFVDKIKEWITDKDIHSKKIQELLKQEVNNWKQFEMLMEADKLEVIYQNKDDLVIGGEELGLLIGSSAKCKSDEIKTYWINTVDKLNEHEKEKLLDVALALVTNKDGNVRWNAVDLISNILESFDESVRRRIFEYFKKLLNEESVVYVRRRMVETLIEIDKDITKGMMIELINDSDSLIVREVMESFRSSISEEFLRELVGFLSAKNADKYKGVVSALDYIADEYVIDCYLKFLSEKGSEIYWNTAKALSGLKSEKAVGYLVDKLQSKDEEERKLASEALSYVKVENMLDRLIELIYDADEELRKKAVQILKEIGDESALRRIEPLLVNNIKYVSDAAEEIVERLMEKFQEWS